MTNNDSSPRGTARTPAVPDPTMFLFFAVATLAWFAAGGMGTLGLVITAVFALPFIVWIGAKLASRPEAGMVLLIAAAAMPRGFVEIGGLKARPEHIAAGILCLAIPLLIRNRHLSPQWIVPDFVLAGYLAINIVSSLFMSVEPGQTLKWSIQQLMAILPYFFLRVLAGNFTGLKTAFRIFLIIGIAEAAFGVLCFYSNIIFKTEIGMEVGQYGDIPGTFGTQYEANILGSYCGACSVVLLAMFLYYRRRSLLIGYSITLMGMAISLSRGALAATVFGFAVLLFFSHRLKHLNRKAIKSVGIATLCVALIVMPALISRYVERFKTLEVSDPTSDDNTMTRLVQFALALDGIAQHPVLGNGTSSFQLQVTRADIDFGSDVFWISNTELRVLHDTGIAGLGLFLTFLGMLIWQSIKALKHRFRPELFGMLAACAVYLVSFQLTEGTLLAFTWVHVGLIACFVAIQNLDNSNGQLELA